MPVLGCIGSFGAFGLLISVGVLGSVLAAAGTGLWSVLGWLLD